MTGNTSTRRGALALPAPVIETATVTDVDWVMDEMAVLGSHCSEPPSLLT